MMEFEKQAEIMDMKEELMNDAIDDAMGDEDDEEERWGATGTTGATGTPGTWGGGAVTPDLCPLPPALPAPGGSLAAGEGRAPEAAAPLADADADLEERLKNLRRD
ncbi:CHM2A protein, partial [Alopecoenas beccarii]|nr:CHM2A protein [Alopecoenas beccarii]